MTMSGGRSPAGADAVRVARRIVEGVRRAAVRRSGTRSLRHRTGRRDRARRREARFRRATAAPSSGQRARPRRAARLCPATSATCGADRRQPVVRLQARRDVASARRCATSTTPRCQRPVAAWTTRPAGRAPAQAHVAVPRIHCGRPNSVVGGRRRQQRRDRRIERRRARDRAATSRRGRWRRTASRRATSRADRSTRSAPPATASRRRACPRGDVGDPQLGAVPRHLRVAPREPAQPAAVRAEARRRVEVVARGEHVADRRPPSSGMPTSVVDGLASRLGVVLAHADQPPARRDRARSRA